jgi:hypothetical protein
MIELNYEPMTVGWAFEGWKTEKANGTKCFHDKTARA